MGERMYRRHGRGGPLAILMVAVATFALPLAAGAADDPVGTITMFDTSEPHPHAITEGPDGNLWFTTTGWTDYTDPENPIDHPGQIGRMTPEGVDDYLPAGWLDQPWSITSGPDGNLWFVDIGADSVGRVTPDGVITQFTDPDIDAPAEIVAGPDGNLWFTIAGGVSAPDAIGRITPAGVITTFTHSSLSGPTGITSGPGGALWFANATSNPMDGSYSIGRITTAGVISSFEVDRVERLTTGPDGNLWFTEGYPSTTIGRMTPTGAVTVFSDPKLKSPSSIAPGPDGNLWFTNNDHFSVSGDSIGRITPSGAITTFPDDRLSLPPRITPGPGDDMWFTSMNDSIGRIELGAIPTFTDVPVNHPFFDDIEWLADSGVTGGFDDSTFRPGSPVTRGSMAAFLYRFAGSPAHTPPVTSPFSDVPTSHLFYDEITWLAASGVTGGFDDGTFRPGESVTRGSMAAFLYRYASSPAFTPPASPSFPDVPTSHPFFDEIEWLVDVEVTGGFGDGSYRPGASVTRGSMAAFLHRFAVLP